MAHVVVTGAGGFIGAELCASLADRGHQVLAVVRNRADSRGRVPYISHLQVSDLRDELDSSGWMTGVDAVVHLAARVHRIGEQSAVAEALYRRENTELTRCLAEAAARSGVRRLIFMSSVKALGERSSEERLFPGSDPRPEDAYGRSKLAAERVLAQVAMRTGLEVAIIRSPLVYGPAVGANFRQLVTAVARGIPLPLGAISNRRSIVSVWNLADFTIRCLGPMPSALETFHVTDDRPVSTPELIRLIGEGLGRSPRLFSLPPRILTTLLRVAGGGALVDRLIGSLELDTAESFAALGWKPPLSVEEGVVRAVREMAL